MKGFTRTGTGGFTARSKSTTDTSSTAITTTSAEVPPADTYGIADLLAHTSVPGPEAGHVWKQVSLTAANVDGQNAGITMDDGVGDDILVLKIDADFAASGESFLVTGDAGDLLYMDEKITFKETTTWQGHDYHVYDVEGGAKVIVDADLTVTKIKLTPDAPEDTPPDTGSEDILVDLAVLLGSSDSFKDFNGMWNTLNLKAANVDGINSGADMTDGAGNDRIILKMDDVFATSDEIFTVLGDVGDKLYIDNSFLLTETKSHEGHDYKVYAAESGGVTLVVDADIAVTSLNLG